MIVDKIPSNISKVKVTFHVLCMKDGDKIKWRHSVSNQTLSRKNMYCGFRVFPSSHLRKMNSMSWRIGLKITRIRYKNKPTHCGPSDNFYKPIFLCVILCMIASFFLIGNLSVIFAKGFEDKDESFCAI